jgi:hypothetical protein
MRMSSNDWWEYLKWASSHHLTETFPDAVLSDSETDEYEMHEERLKWVDLHVTERNENRDRDDIFDEIHVLAVSAYDLVKEKLNA